MTTLPALPLDQLDYAFTTPPLLIGGKAMEHYGLRPAGDDIDLVATSADYAALAARHPDYLKDLYGDLGVCIGPFEVWTSILLFDYDALSAGALDRGAYRVIALEKLLLLKCLSLDVPKHAAGVRLIAQRIRDIQYGNAQS